MSAHAIDMMRKHSPGGEDASEKYVLTEKRPYKIKV